MLFTTAASIAVLGLATTSNAHIIMKTPVPFGKSTLNNSPLEPSGSDYPCKQRAGVYSAEGANNVMPLGSTQPLEFTGSAVHGGGSCQISITYDKEPTKNSVFKVIHSIEGGCPMKNVEGNNGDSANAVDPSTYSFTIPSNLPTGDAVLSWTWLNKIGNREFYQNCAPVTLTAASSKRDSDLEARNTTQLVKRDQAAFDALPDMFMANVGNGCTTESGKDTIYPNPGDSLERLGLATSSALAAPIGSCATASGGSSPTAPAAVPTAASSVAPVVSSAASSAASSVAGGVFVTTLVTSVTTSAALTQASPAASAAPSASASAAAPAAPVSSGSAGAMTGPCTSEGVWNCIGGTSFQACASGSWTQVQPVAAGTKCTPGQSMGLEISAAKGKRSIGLTHRQPRH